MAPGLGPVQNRNLALAGAITQVWTKMILWTVLPPGPKFRTAAAQRRSRHGERKIGSGLRMSGRSLPEDDQRQVQAAHRLGPAGWSPALWRDQNRPAAGLDRDFGNHAAGAVAGIEGADRVRADRPPGLRRRAA